MNGYEIKQTLKNGGMIAGTMVMSTSPKWPNYVKEIGLDFVFIDNEHVLMDSSTLSWMCMMYSSLGIAPIVRIPSADPFRATNVIDGGAQGIVVPYMENIEELKRMVGAVHKKPVKGDKLKGELDGDRPFNAYMKDYVENSNKNNMLFVNIESLYALEHLDEILSVEGLDGIVIGPNDLSFSMDIPNAYADEKFNATVVEILRRSREKGIAAGIHASGDIKNQIAWAKASGMNMLWHATDVYMFVNGMKREIAEYKTALGASAESFEKVSIEI